MSATDSFDEMQMLHPMTLIQRFLIAIPAFIVLLFPFLRSPQSSDYFSIGTVVIYSLLALPLIFLRYYRFRYRITRKEIIIQSGIINRQHRSIPIERIQNIEIEQSVLPRLFGTAKVKIETAGSAKTEGVLEYVSVERAHQIRKIVRSYQQEQIAPQNEASPQEAPAAALPSLEQTAYSSAPENELGAPLFAMTLGRVLLTGMLRFSLFYIAIAFSVIQQFNPDPDEIELWLTKGWLHPLAELYQNSPWLFTIAGIVFAVSLSWITGILVSLNRNYNFKIWLKDQKLHKHHGLLTLSQGTIPLKRIQALIFRANMLMRKLDWVALEVQTMGLESAQRGHQMAVPLGKFEETVGIAKPILPISLPDVFTSVSPLTIRRAIIRLTMLTTFVLVPLGYFWQPAFWGLIIILLIPWYAVLRFRNHGYALIEDMLYVRRGVFQHYIWAIPVSKFQVLYTTASLFQRRLGLSTVYVDTAGAGGFASPEIIDIDATVAEELVSKCYSKFQESFSSPASTS